MERATFALGVRDLCSESINAVCDFGNEFLIHALDIAVQFLYSRSDTLVVVSPALVDPISESGVSSKKIYYHPNGVDPEQYDTDDSDSTVSMFFDNRFTISYVGTIGRAQTPGGD